MATRKTYQNRRNKSLIEPKQKFILFCEGKNTEPAYFSALNDTLNGILIRTKGGKGGPSSIARKAVKHVNSGETPKSHRRRNLFGKKDQFWAVFDRDQHSNFDHAVKQCEDNNIGVAHSNPCFEVWLVLHETDFNKAEDCRTVQKLLEKLRPEYDAQNKKFQIATTW